MDRNELAAQRQTAGTQGLLAPPQRRRRMEIFAFLFLTMVLIPALAVATVGGYGLTVWVYQMIAGPPGPPGPPGK